MSVRRDDTRTLIGVADGEFATTIELDGTLVREYGDAPTNIRLYDGVHYPPIAGYELTYGATVFAIGDETPTLLRDLSPTQKLSDGRLPMVVTTAEIPDATVSVLSFGWHVHRRLVDFTRLRVHNVGQSARSVSVWAGQRGKRRSLDGLRRFPRPGDRGWQDDLLVLDDRIHVVADPAPSSAGHEHPGRDVLDRELSDFDERLREMPGEEWGAELAAFELELGRQGFEHGARWDLTVPPGEHEDIWIKTPVHVHTEDESDALRAAGGEACLQAARDAWATLLAPAAGLDLPDAGVVDMYWAALAALLLLRQRIGDHYLVYPGKREYRRFWTRDAAYMCWALDLAGLADEAERSLAYFLHLQRHPEERWVFAQSPPLQIEPSKSFECPVGQYDGQGQVPWALLEHYRLTRDDAWLERAYPHLRDAADWTHEARELLASPRYADAAPTPGLVPPSIGEGWSNDPDYYFVHQLWALHGLACVGEAAEQLGEYDDREWIDREHADFSDALARAIELGYVEEDGAARLAMVPEPERDINSSMTQQHIAFLCWPRRIAGVSPERVSRLFDSYQAAFAPEGLLGYRIYPLEGLAMRELVHRRGAYRSTGQWPFEHRMVWSYGSCDMARALLELGRAAEATAIFERFAGLATPTNGWVEMVDLETNTGHGDGPHGWAAANFITLLRLLLVREEGDKLHLLQGVPRSWLEPGSEIALRDLPTYFGPLTLQVESRATETSLSIECASGRAPEQIVIHLAGRRVASVQVDGEQREVTGDSIDVPGDARRVLVLFGGEGENDNK